MTPSKLFRRSQAWLYNAGILLSVSVSAGGVLYGALISKKCVDGQRGGAIGVAAAFSILFLSRNYGERVYKSILDTNPDLKARVFALSKEEAVEDFSNKDLTWAIISILGRLNVEADEQRRQNIALVIASVIATLAWGFGDVIAGWVSSCKL